MAGPAEIQRTSGGLRPHRVLEAAGIAALLGLVAWGAVRVARTVDGVAAAGWALGGVLAGYLLADLASGLVHWLGDRYGSEQTPLVGQNFVRPFREHHVDPKGMTRHDFIETNGNNSLVTLPVVGAGYLLFSPGAALGTFGFCAVVSLGAWIFATNQFHKWSHQEALPPVVGWLQRRGVILAPDHHDVHHRWPYETYYCITSGLLNPLLHRLRFWARAERLVERLTGLAAYRDPGSAPSQPVAAAATPAPPREP